MIDKNFNFARRTGSKKFYFYRKSRDDSLRLEEVIYQIRKKLSAFQKQLPIFLFLLLFKRHSASLNSFSCSKYLQNPETVFHLKVKPA